jgi:hypothetical protein
MSDIDPIHSEGVITKGDSFELDRPRQVVFDIQATCKEAHEAYLETTLEFVTTGAAPLVISRTNLNSSVASAFTNGASLYLPQGKYAFTARIRANAGGSLSAPDISQAKATLNLDPGNPFSLGQCAAAGSSESFVLVSTGKESPIEAEATIRATLPKAEYLSGVLRITDLSTGGAMATPRAMLRGVNLNPLGLEAVPFWLKTGRLYRFDCDMIYGGQTNISQAMLVRG